MKKPILLMLLLGGLYSSTLFAQEVRVQGNMLILGYIDDPFIGAGAGIEAGLGEHFSLNFDANWGTQERGSTWEFRPAVNYYFGKELCGLFVGGTLKYISLNESDEANGRWDDSLYAIGFNVGFKAKISEKMTMTFVASPHKTVGGDTEADVAGISAQFAIGYRF
jgi:uncharacterized protein DUF3575